MWFCEEGGLWCYYGIFCFAGVILFALLLFIRRVFWPEKFTDELLEWRAKGKYYKFKHNQKTYNIFYRDSTDDVGGKERKKIPYLILIHGYPTASWDWHLIWESLAKSGHWRILAVDMLGFGFSDKPNDRSLFYNGLHVQADLIQSFIRDIHESSPNSSEPIIIHYLAHDYGDTVAQELLFRYKTKLQNEEQGVIHQHPHNDNYDYKIASVFYLNGGILPGHNTPLLSQKIIALPWIGAIVCRLFNKVSFTRSFRKIFGQSSFPSHEEITNFWLLLCNNSGKRLQSALMQYLGERIRNKTKWSEVLRYTDVPQEFLCGPCDPISGKHLAYAIMQYLGANRKFVTLLPDQFGHYPQVECPSLVLQHYYRFIDYNFNLRCS